MERGGIASIKGYRPSRTAKRFECIFVFRQARETMEFSLRSNGVREPTLSNAHYGYGPKLGNRSNTVYHHSKHKDGFMTEGRLNVECTPLKVDLCLVIIDDGDKLNVEYQINDSVYKMELESNTISEYYRAMVCNRDIKGNIAYVKELQLSIITE